MTLDAFTIKEDVFYHAQGKEIDIAEACFRNQYPLMLRGPTGTGKTTLVQHLAHRFQIPLVYELITEDTTADTLVGSFNLNGWYDGSASLAIQSKHGALLYLDEIGEGRPDAIVVVHGLTDDRRQLDIRAQQKKFHATENFMVIASYNPTYQQQVRLKPSTLQRFVTVDIDFPNSDVETYILKKRFGEKTNIPKPDSSKTSSNPDNCLELIVKIANDYRDMAVAKEIREGPSPRLTIMTYGLIKAGIPFLNALESGMINPLTHDPEQKKAMIDSIKKI